MIFFGIFSKTLYGAIIKNSPPSTINHAVSNNSTPMHTLKQVYIEKDVFQIHSSGTHWIQVTPEEKAKDVLTEYLSTKNKLHGSLTVRLLMSPKYKNLRKNKVQWAKEYTRIGLHVLEAKILTFNNKPALKFYLENKASHRKILQIISFKKKNVAVLTCQSPKTTFFKVFKDCKTIMTNFQWL